MKFKFDNDKIESSISSNSFDLLKKLEDKGKFKEEAFREETGKKVEFFHLGPKNNWENLLDRGLADEIKKRFKRYMEELNYF